jgi:mxaJ protein
MRRAVAGAIGIALWCACAPGGDTAKPASHERVLRVCADPNNLPFSNVRGEGFENELTRIIAADMGVGVQYTWWAQRRGFVRNTLRENLCDVIVGIAASHELVLATRPYYRSTYVFATRVDRRLDIQSFDDPRLRTLKVGVHFIGDDGANAPPAHALTKRGIVRNVRGYSIYGDYAQPNPPMRLVEAVVRGEIDVAIVWGPFAGWARQNGAPITITPVSPQVDVPFLPFVYDIAVGVRRGDDSLKVRLESVLDRRRPEVRALLRRYGVPLVETPRRRVLGDAEATAQ